MRYPLIISDFDKLINRLDILIAQNDKTFTNDAIVAFLGGFSGAFFAFMFGRFAGDVDKKKERYLKHQHAMVKMEYLLVKHQDKVSRLVYLLRNTINILKSGKFTHNRFPGLNVIEDIELELGDINLINEVSNYWLSVERVNNDCNSLNRILEALQQIVISGVMPHRDNFIHLIGQMELLMKYLEEPFIEENITLNAYIRILLEKERGMSEFRKLLKLYKITEHKVSTQQINKIKKEIYKEINKRKKEDTERLRNKK